MVSMKIKMVYSNTKTYNGIKAYSLNLYNEMSESMDVALIPLPKIEVVIRGKKVGGWTSQRLMAWTVGDADIVHSTSHWDLTPHTNVVTIHDLYPIIQREYFNTSDRAMKFYLSMLRKVRERCKHIVVQGKHIEEQVRRYIPDIPISVIPTKVFVDKPTVNPYPDDGKLHLITMGEIHGDLPNRKQIYELYDWVKDLDGVDLYHIGRITDLQYIGYSPNIHQLGSVSQQDKFNYLAYADKYVFKTIGEGQGFPTMEAMKLNTQVVINDLPEHRNLLGDKPYYYHTRDEFIEMIYKPKKSGLVEQISQYDNWVEKYKKVYEEVTR
jgi:hypothetical protein